MTSLSKLAVAAMTVAFLLVLTGLQHFDGLIDLGNAFGLRSLHDRKMVAHAWTVTYWGAVLALVVEFVAFAGLFLIIRFTLSEPSSPQNCRRNCPWSQSFGSAKPTHKGLGSIFLQKAKNKLNIIAYILCHIDCLPVFRFDRQTLLWA